MSISILNFLLAESWRFWIKRQLETYDLSGVGMGQAGDNTNHAILMNRVHVCLDKFFNQEQLTKF